jgi:carbon-monoxide dehydrogenase large subunit
LLTGRGTYVADMQFPGLVDAAVLRSPFAHARIDGIDVSAATELDGVIAVFTADDLDGKVQPFTRAFYEAPDKRLVAETNLVVRPYHADVIARERVTRVGEPVAVVVAADRYVAEDALELIDVQYEPLSPIVDVDQALADGATVLHPDYGDNVHCSFTVRGGDVKDAFGSAHHVVKESFRVGRSVGTPLETRGTLAVWDAGNQALVTYTTNQRPHLLRTYVSEMLGLPEEKVRIVSPDMGGSFGGGIYAEEILVSHIARELARPARWIEDRQENLLNARHSRDQRHDVEVAFNADGRIVGLKDRFTIDNGMHNPMAITLPFNTVAHLRGEFKISNFEIGALCAVTNKLQNTPVRGAGRPEASFVMDRIVDIVASHVGLDPTEVRARNLIPAEDMPFDMGMMYRDGKPMVYDGGDYPAQLRMTLGLAQYDKLREEQSRLKAEGRHIGIGVAAYVEGSGYGPFEGAHVRIDASGSVAVHSGSNPHGQAHETTLAQVAADELGVHPDNVIVRAGDTALVQHGAGTYASRSAVTAGSAVYLAARKVRDKVATVAAHLLEIDPADVDVADGKVFARGVPDSSLPLADVARATVPGSRRLPEGVEPGLEATEYFVPPTVTFASGTHVAVVEVDVDTGFVRVLRYYVVDDCGVVLNPMVVDGQIDGGVAHGVGIALLEEAVFNEEGQPLTGTFMDYLLPTAMESPPVEIEHQEFASPLNPLGAKGCGEGGTVAAPAAVANAICDALKPLPVKLNEMPMTPERVFRAIQKAKEQMVPAKR